METWQYGHLTILTGVYPRLPDDRLDTQAPRQVWAMVWLGAGHTGQKVDDLVVFFDQLGADGWQITEARHKITDWWHAALTSQELMADSSIPATYLLKRRVVAQ
jgi:hypothetical protein